MNTQRPAPAQAQHSPLPWASQVPPSSCLTDRFIVAADGEIVAEIGGRYSALNGDVHTTVKNTELIVRACNEYEILTAKLQVTNATVDHYEKRQLELIKEAGDAKAHAQRLAEALKEVIEVESRFSTREATNSARFEAHSGAREALAQWEKAQ